jgi:hypothetical protein
MCPRWQGRLGSVLPWYESLVLKCRVHMMTRRRLSRGVASTMSQGRGSTSHSATAASNSPAQVPTDDVECRVLAILDDRVGLDFGQIASGILVAPDQVRRALTQLEDKRLISTTPTGQRHRYFLQRAMPGQ